MFTIALSVPRDPLADSLVMSLCLWKTHQMWGNHHASFPLILPWTPLCWEADMLAYLASGRQELRLSFCAFHCFSSLSFHLLLWCAASNRGCKWCRTGAGILLVHAEWCYDPSESAWKPIHWLIPSWRDSSRNELQMPSEDPFHGWPACFEQWVPFSCVSPHICFIHFLDFLLSFHYPFIFLPHEASKEMITISMPARRQGWDH